MLSLTDLGLDIPDTKLAEGALALLRASSPGFICNHCLRTYTFGSLAARKLGKAFDPEIAFVASALHDIGLIPEYQSEDERFEIDSADIARNFVLQHGVPEKQADIVWDAIAFHTSTGLPMRREPEVALVYMGAGMDVFGISLDSLPGEVLEAILDAYPRLGFKDAFRKVLIDYAVRKPMAQVFTWTSDIAHAHVPSFPCPVISKAFDASPFPE